MLRRSSIFILYQGHYFQSNCNLFGIHRITASKVIYDVCLAVVKHLASKSVWSASFAVFKSSSIPKPSLFAVLCVIPFIVLVCLRRYTCLYTPSLEISMLLIKPSTISYVHVNRFSPVLTIYIDSSIFFRKNVFQTSFQKTESLLMCLRMCIILSKSKTGLQELEILAQAFSCT